MLSIPEQFNVATYFVDRNVHEGRGERIAIECGEQRVTYRELLENTNRLGNALRTLGVRREERVSLLLLDCPEFLYCFFGAIKIGAIAVPTNTLLKPAEHEYILNDSRAKVMFVSEALLPQVEQIPKNKLRYLQHMVVVGESGGSQRLRELMADASPHLAPESTSKDDVAFWLYSSGSTGPPKGCVHLHHDMVVCSELYARNILRMTESDRCYSVARLFFAYGLGNAAYFPLAFGATSILSPERPTPAGIYANIERYRPTLFFSVPTNYAALLAYRRGTGNDFDLSSIGHAISAGEALPAGLFHRFKERFGIEILDALGSTENLHMVTSNLPGEVRPGSSGKVIPGYEVRIVDEQDQPVPVGEIGNLLIKGDSLCAGYWEQPDKTKAAFQGEWFRTGDRYWQDEKGYLWFAGRSGDLFKVSGSYVSPMEVESALAAHPAVQESAVVGREDGDGLLRPAAYVVLNSEYAADDALVRQLQEWVGERLGNFKRPRWVEFVEELPKTSTGKLQRYKLREREMPGSKSQR